MRRSELSSSPASRRSRCYKYPIVLNARNGPARLRGHADGPLSPQLGAPQLRQGRRTCRDGRWLRGRHHVARRVAGEPDGRPQFQRARLWRVQPRAHRPVVLPVRLPLRARAQGPEDQEEPRRVPPERRRRARGVRRGDPRGAAQGERQTTTARGAPAEEPARPARVQAVDPRAADPLARPARDHLRQLRHARGHAVVPTGEPALDPHPAGLVVDPARARGTVPVPVHPARGVPVLVGPRRVPAPDIRDGVQRPGVSHRAAHLLRAHAGGLGDGEAEGAVLRRRRGGRREEATA